MGRDKLPKAALLQWDGAYAEFLRRLADAAEAHGLRARSAAELHDAAIRHLARSLGVPPMRRVCGRKRAQPPKLSEAARERIVQLSAQGADVETLAGEFDRHPSTIRRIVREAQ